MAILKTYPLKSNYYGPDRIILSDMEPDSQGIVHGNTKNLTLSNLKNFVSNTLNGLTGNISLTGGTGISVSTSTNTISIANTGVTSLVAGSNINISGSTGAVTISASASGNIGGSGTANSVALFSNTSNVGDSIMKQFSGNDGSGFNDTYFQLAGTGGAWMGNIRLGSVGGVAGGDGYLLDSTGVRGSDGQVLTSTGFQSKWEDVPSTGLQIGTFANKTTTLSAQNSSISFTSADNGTSVSVASTLSVGSITAKTVPYVTSGGEFNNSNLTFTDSSNMDFSGNIGISNGKLSIATGGDKLTLKGPADGGDYELQLPSKPTSENLVLTITGSASPYESSWEQPTTGTVTGSGTADTLAIWKTGTELTNSSISQNASDDITIGGSILYITPYVSGGLKIKDDGSQVTLSGPQASTGNYELKLPSKPSAGGQVLAAPATLGNSPYQLEWIDASITSTNNVTASANSLNLQGSSSTAPTFGAPLNINYAGKPASAVDGTSTAIHIDMTTWDGTGDNLPARGITCDMKRSTTALHVNNADQVSSKVAKFVASSGEVGSITCTNIATTYATSSDYRIKENVVDMTGAVDRVKQLKPSRFNFTADPSKTVDGFLAHEAQEVVPEAVVGIKDDLDNSGNDLLQSMDHSKIVPLLTGAIKELIARIEELEAK